MDTSRRRACGIWRTDPSLLTADDADGADDRPIRVGKTRHLRWSASSAD